MSALTIHAPVPAVPRRRPDAVVIPFPQHAPPRDRCPRPAPAAAAPAALSITRRGRLTITVLGVALLTLAVLAVTAGPAAPAPGSAPASPAVEQVVVLPGDTLWGIASAVAAPGEDVRDLIVRIRELNGLSSSGLTVGQRLAVPVTD